MDGLNIAIWLANSAIVSTVYAGIALGIIHLSNHEYDIISQPMSYYAVGTSSYLMATVILTFAASMMLLGFALEQSIPGLSRKGIALLKVAGASLAIAAIFPSDVTDNWLPETSTGFVHTIASYLFSPCLVIATLLLSRQFNAPHFCHIPTFVLALASWLSLIVLTLVNLFNLQIGGIGQRIFVGLTWLWLMVTELRLQKTLRRL